MPLGAPPPPTASATDVSLQGFSFSFQSHPEPVDEKVVGAAAQTPAQMDPRCKTVDVEKVRAGGFSGAVFAGGLPGGDQVSSSP